MVFVVATAFILCILTCKLVKMSKKKAGWINDNSEADGLGEFELISRIAPLDKRTGPGVHLGVGDDTAVLSLSEGTLLLATCDSQIQGVHFRLDFSTPFEIGQRCAAVNLSDIAAMGGTPRYALVSLSVPHGTRASLLAEMYDGMRDMFSRFETTIVGGNTSSTTGPLAIEITLLGEGAPHRILTRSGATPGDVVCVTGVLGASRAGLSCLMNGSLNIGGELRDDALLSYRTPWPRVDVGSILAANGHVSACMDISDGLAGDAAHLADRSGVAVLIDLEKIPVSKAAVAVSDETHQDPCVFAAKGGEDFELLFTIERAHLTDISVILQRQTGVAVTPIGEISNGEGVYFRYYNDIKIINMSGFDHFKRP